MREFTVRAYEDHWIVQEEAGGTPEIIEGADALVKALAWQPIEQKPKRTYPKGTRRRRKASEVKDAALGAQE